LGSLPPYVAPEVTEQSWRDMLRRLDEVLMAHDADRRMA